VYAIFIERASVLADAIFPVEVHTARKEGVKLNTHTRFISEDSDLSEFSDSLEEIKVDHELRVLHNRRRKHKLKRGWGNDNKNGELAQLQAVEPIVMRSNGRKWRKEQSKSSLGFQEGLRGVGDTTTSLVGKAISSLASGLHLIIANSCEVVPESPVQRLSQDPFKFLEAESLLGYQKCVGFSYTTEDKGNTERIEKMEHVDVNKKVIKGRSIGAP
jgi:hypothetical protein